MYFGNTIKSRLLLSTIPIDLHFFPAICILIILQIWIAAKKCKSIVIVEGHYSGYNEIYNYLDYNILLLADKHELLKRKIDRVKNYRDPKETAKYFELIDVPSFINYLTRFGNNYNMIVDNSNYFQPVIKNKKIYWGRWRNNR